MHGSPVTTTLQNLWIYYQAVNQYVSTQERPAVFPTTNLTYRSSTRLKYSVKRHWQQPSHCRHWNPLLENHGQQWRHHLPYHQK